MKSRTVLTLLPIAIITFSAMVPTAATATPTTEHRLSILDRSARATDTPASAVLSAPATKILPSVNGSYRLATRTKELKIWFSRQKDDSDATCITAASMSSEFTVVNCVDSRRLAGDGLDLVIGQGATATTVKVAADASTFSKDPATSGFTRLSSNVWARQGVAVRGDAVTARPASPTALRSTRISDTFYDGKIKQNTVINSPVRKKIVGAGTQAVKDDSATAYIASGIYYAEGPQAVAISFSSRTASAACKWTYILPSYNVANPMKCVTYHY